LEAQLEAQFEALCRSKELRIGGPASFTRSRICGQKGAHFFKTSPIRPG
jgi:hypothetical protein